MKLTYSNIINKHKGKPCAVALHGPSLDTHKEKIQELQKNKELLRFSVNEWYDYFIEKPDYWVVSNGEFTIDASIKGSPIWDSREYPHDVFNKYNIPLLYNTVADLTDEDLIKQKLKCDYFPYDSRHFKGRTCREILKSLKEHYEKYQNLDFKYYGNNSKMWAPPNVKGLSAWMQQLHGRVGGGWHLHNKCCTRAGETTLQEKLQELSGHPQHMSTGHTVGMFAIAFAALMGCNPIYVTGLDLDCSVGYAKNTNIPAQFNAGHTGHWKIIFRDFLLDDMRILNESAKLLGTEIINLNKESWHNEFFKGDLDL